MVFKRCFLAGRVHRPCETEIHPGDFGVSFLFIAHDLSFAEYMAGEVAVTDAGKIVERGSTEKIFAYPGH